MRKHTPKISARPLIIPFHNSAVPSPFYQSIQSISARVQNRDRSVTKNRGNFTVQRASWQRSAPISFMAAGTFAAGPTGFAQSSKQLRHSTGLHPVHNYMHIGPCASLLWLRRGTRRNKWRAVENARQIRQFHGR